MREKNIVCFGGGTGLPTLLSGLKNDPWLRITALVNMFDTGGSSGELKDRFGVLPPGDVLKCLLALSENEIEARKLLLHRIRNVRYSGHTGGNVLLLGLEKVYGSFAEAISALSQLLSLNGDVVPITYEHAVLCARYTSGETYRTETSVDMGIFEGKVVEQLFLEPDVGASSSAVEAIGRADVICVGPGSFYTSVLPNLLPKGVRESIQISTAPIIYIANLLTEGAGMQNQDINSLVGIVEAYLGRKVTTTVVNNRIPGDHILSEYGHERKYPIVCVQNNADSAFVSAPLWADEPIARHDKMRLSYLVSSLIHDLVKHT